MRLPRPREAHRRFDGGGVPDQREHRFYNLSVPPHGPPSAWSHGLPEGGGAEPSQGALPPRRTGPLRVLQRPPRPAPPPPPPAGPDQPRAARLGPRERAA